MINFCFIKRSYSIAILGPPASGKGTIAKWLSKDFSASHISTGDLLRQNSSDPSIFSGSLASDTLVLKLLKSHLNSLSINKFCLDGFPRRKSQAEVLEKFLKPNGLEAVILLDLPESILMERITDRWIHQSSGRTYSYSFSPPKTRGVDDITGEPLIQRQDDLLESFLVRMKNYNEHLDHIKDFYSKRGILYSFTGNNSKEIYDEIFFQMKSKYHEIPKIAQIN